MNNSNKIDNEQLVQIVGGFGDTSNVFDLSHYVWRRVVNVPDGYYLQCRIQPNGAVIDGVGWANNEGIVVHESYRPSGWYLAYHEPTGRFGYVCPTNIA